MQEKTKTDFMADLDNLDQVILRYKLQGLKDSEIVEKTGKHRSTIADRQKNPNFELALTELKKNALDILLEGQADAARILRHIARNKSAKDADRIAACKEILKGVLSDKHDLNMTGDAPLNINIAFIKAEKGNGKDE